jgi:hypothetical protein
MAAESARREKLIGLADALPDAPEAERLLEAVQPVEE